MKVITEETLKEMRASRIYPEWVIDCLIRNNLKDIGSIHEEHGQIIVDDLRPMSELKNNEFALCYELHNHRRYGDFEKYQKYGMNMVDINGNEFDMGRFVGWIPMPTFRPKDGA